MMEKDTLRAGRSERDSDGRLSAAAHRISAVRRPFWNMRIFQ